MKNLFRLFLATLIIFSPLNLLAQEKSSNIDKKNLAIMFSQSNDYAKAIEILLSIGPENFDQGVLELLGQFYYLNHQPAEAISYLKAKRDKEWFDYVYIGLSYEDHNDIGQAIKAYEKSLGLNQNSISFTRLAKIYRKKKNWAKAVNYFKQALSFDSSQRLANYYLGECLIELDEYDQAYAYLSKAILFYPNDKHVKEKLKVTKQALGEDFFKDKIKEKKGQRKSLDLSPYLRDSQTPLIKIGLGVGLDNFSFSCGGKFIVTDSKNRFKGKANHFYTLKIEKGKLSIFDRESKMLMMSFLSDITISSVKEGDEQYHFGVLDVVYGEGDFWHKTIDRVYKGDLLVISKANKITLVNVLGSQDYLKGVLSAEIPASSNQEALKAQAIAARTLIFKNKGRHSKDGFDFCDDVHCQAYRGQLAQTPATDKAVDETRGIIMVYKDEPIEAFYHSNSGGCLAADVFGTAEYLESKLDSEQGQIPDSLSQEHYWFLDKPQSYSRKSSHFRWQRIYDREDLAILFPQRLKMISGVEQGDCFRYKKMDVYTWSGSKTLTSGLKIRNYFDKLKSNAFKLDLKSKGNKDIDMIIFWGAGFGHGTGMSQQGAMNMAKSGYDYSKILKHYYPQVNFEKIY